LSFILRGWAAPFVSVARNSTGGRLSKSGGKSGVDAPDAVAGFPESRAGSRGFPHIEPKSSRE
jgi:hypothetical protein